MKIRKFCENAEIVVLLKRKHGFRGPRSVQNDPPGAPGSPKRRPAGPKTKKRRTMYAVIRFGRSRAAPPPSFSRVLRSLGVFLGSPGGALQILGRSRSSGKPRKHVRNHAWDPFGRPGGSRGRFSPHLGSLLSNCLSILGRFRGCRGYIKIQKLRG